jgi:hypothetical protein
VSDDFKVINAPERIYLQIGDDFDPGEVDFSALQEVTWCADNIHGTDIAYLRADALEAANARIASLEEQIGAAAGWKLVPVEPTMEMVVDGFESWPSPIFSGPEEWAAYEAMSGCQQAAHRARLCYAAMLAAAPTVALENGGELSLRGQHEDACIAANKNAQDAERYRFLAASAFKHLLPTAETIDAAIAKEPK